MDLVSVTEAGKMKECTGQAVRDAVRKGLIDAHVFGRTFVIVCNKKWREWHPNPKMQSAAKTSWAGRRSTKRSGAAK